MYGCTFGKEQYLMYEFCSDYQNSIRGKWGANYSLGEMGGGGLDVKTIA